MFFFFFRYKLYGNLQKIPCELLDFSLSTRHLFFLGFLFISVFQVSCPRSCRWLIILNHTLGFGLLQSIVESYRSQYITISSSFTDAFLPSSPHSTPNHLLLHRPCCRRCLIAGMFPSEAIIVASQYLQKR